MPKDNPVLRVLFHADKQNLHNEHHGRAQSDTNSGYTYRSSPSTICVQLLATLDSGNKNNNKHDFAFGSKTNEHTRSATCTSNGRDGTCLGQITLPASWWPSLVGISEGSKGGSSKTSSSKASLKQPKVNVRVSYLVYETRGQTCKGSEGNDFLDS